MEKIHYEIIYEICKALQDLGASEDLLSVVAGWGDTLEDDEVLQLLSDYNRTGTIWAVVHECNDKKRRVPDLTVIEGKRGDMRARKWRCSHCGLYSLFSEPQPAPSPCSKCGSITFECDDQQS